MSGHRDYLASHVPLGMALGMLYSIAQVLITQFCKLRMWSKLLILRTRESGGLAGTHTAATVELDWNPRFPNSHIHVPLAKGLCCVCWGDTPSLGLEGRTWHHLGPGLGPSTLAQAITGTGKGHPSLCRAVTGSWGAATASLGNPWDYLCHEENGKGSLGVRERGLQGGRQVAQYREGGGSARGCGQVRRSRGCPLLTVLREIQLSKPLLEEQVVPSLSVLSCFLFKCFFFFF